MEKNPPERSESISRNGTTTTNDDDKGNGNGDAASAAAAATPACCPESSAEDAVDVKSEDHHQDHQEETPPPGEANEEEQEEGQEPPPPPELTLPQALEEIDRFIHKNDDESCESPPQIPGSVESLLKEVEKMISNYDSKSKFGQNQEDDSSFIDSLSRIPKIIEFLRKFTPDSAADSVINRASNVLHLAMSFFEAEFRSILEGCNTNNNNNNKDHKTPDQKSKQSSSSGSHQESSNSGDTSEDPESNEAEEYPAYSPEAVTAMNTIASAMISSGYEAECCLIYNMMRKIALSGELDKLGFENISIEEVQKMQWESLEGEITTWINIIRHCSLVLFSGERRLCTSVFLDHPSVSHRLSADLTLSVTVRFLNFAEGIALTKRSAEKLFKYLDMYETVRDLLSAVENTDSSGTALELISEICAAKSRLGEAAVTMFCDLENSIRSDNSRTPVPTGAVHPLTRYTMNYLKYACEYKDTLEQVFQQHYRVEGSSESNEPESEAQTGDHQGPNEDGTPKTSRFSVQLNTVMNLLHENLETKSKLYKDPSLRNIFLMNNGRYILQKIKGTKEIHDTVGVTWCRKQSSDLRMYHKGYTRETWTKLLQTMSPEGLQLNGKVQKPVLKERFKSFNSMFDEIHRTQSAWVVSDEQLQSELRVSVSALVIPAYRSFLGRYQQYFTPGRQTEKYVKYQPEDIENLIDQLFDGNSQSMAKRRT